MRILLLHHCRREAGKFKPMRRTPAKFPRRSGRSIIEKKHHNRQTHAWFRTCHIFSFNIQITSVFLMNNRHSLLYNPVTVVESIRTTIRSSNAAECVEAFWCMATGKRKRPIYKCTEFSERLNSVFSIAFTKIHPLLLMGRATTYYSSTNIYHWKTPDESLHVHIAQER